MPLQPTLVVVDDDPDHSDLLAAWLEHYGYRVLRFDSGDAVVEWASGPAAPVDAFLLDLEMPGRDGLASCRELRGMTGYARTPALLVSGARLEGITERVEEAGVTGVVRKDGEMLSNLHRWLRTNLPMAG